MKIDTILQKIFSLFEPVHPGMKIKTFCPVQTSTKHSPWFLSGKDIFLQLSVAKLLALSLQENVKFFATFQVVPHT
jgi:hypothetical protein